MLGLVSIFYALAIALIPFIAKRIISGDVGSTAFALVRAGGVAAGAALGWSQWLCRGSQSGFRGRNSVRGRGRFVHVYCPGVVHSAACSLDARFHSFGSCERDEQQQQPGRACSERQTAPRFWQPRFCRCHSGSTGRHESSIDRTQ